MGDNIKFSVLVSLFNSITKAKHTLKRSNFRKFLDKFCKPSDYFASIRLIVPSLDRERESYGLKEAQLALCLLDALAVSRDSEDAKKLINWRKVGSNNTGKIAGNFALVATDVLQRRQSSVSGNMTIRELNELLDRLATAHRNARTDILGEMIRKTNWQEMKWIVMIILKDLKLGMSEKTIFQEFHPDAEDLFNVTCDLRFVCEKLSDRNVRHKRQDIEVGKAVRPQYADRAMDCGAALKKLHGKAVVVECKFDGVRIQIHKDGSKINFFSPNFLDHVEYGPGIANVIVDNVLVNKCILDGEMLVWDKSKNCFAPFGANQEIAKAAREGLDSERQLCYVAFDVLYVGDTSVIHQTLKERHDHLRKVVRPVKGRLEVVLPNSSRRADEPCWSIVANHLDDAENFFRDMIRKLEEGVIFKDLGSKWEPGDRSKAKWIKVKPDYLKIGSDLDVLIIGGYYGAGRRGGEIGQFLVGLAERPAPGTYPKRFVSFCRVGTGLSAEDLDELVTKLKPYFRMYEYPKKPPPSFYQVTNHSRERPDVWVENPEKSIIVSVSSDIRVISSEVFAAPYALRFPRIDRVRYDKPWHECLDVESFKELVNSSNGTTRGGGEPKTVRTAKSGRNKRLALTVPSHFTKTDVSSVKGESQIFSNKVFHFVNVPSDHSLDSMHKLVVENGGTFSMNLNDTVTHCIGAGSRGLKYEAAKRRGCDVIHYSWVFDCSLQKQLLPLRPKHFVFLSESSRKKLQEEIDEFSDSYFWDLNDAELKQIFCNVNRSEDAKLVDYYKKKYCPCEKWCCFYGCCIYFHIFVKSHSAEWDIFLNILMRRLKVEVVLGGGKVADNPSEATHIVVLSVPRHELKSEDVMQSFIGDQRDILRRKRLHLIGLQWLEDCFKKEQKLPEAGYSLKPSTLEESVFEDERGENNNDLEKHSAFSAHEESSRKSVQKTVALIRDRKRKQGSAVGTSSRKGKAIVRNPPRTKRAKVGSRPAKLLDISSDNEASEQETDALVKVIPELEMYDNFKPRVQKTSILGKSGLENENSGFDSRDDLSGKNSDKQEEHKTDALAKVSPELEMPDHVFQDVVFDNKPSKQETRTLGVSGLEKRKEEHWPECSDTGTTTLGNSGLVTCCKSDKEYSSSGILEVELGPIQRALLGLKPSVGRTSDATTAVFEGKTFPSTRSSEGSSVKLPAGEPVKKKKVSYKELAKQLLKD